MMLDIMGEGKITYESYQSFWINFLHMYGELLQVKTQYNETSEQLTLLAFEKISKVRVADGDEPKTLSRSKTMDARGAEEEGIN